MTLPLFFFYLFSAIVIASAIMVISSRNPVHSVLFLILAFVNAAGIFMLAGAEFLALILIVVYVGAVAVLFLFVVMMLDVDFAELKAEMARFMPVALLIGVVLLMELGLVFGSWTVSPDAEGLRAAVTPALSETHNTAALGQLIYTKYIYLFQAAGLILLVAMIGAIVLTLRHRKDVKRQVIRDQILRDPAKAMELKDVKPGQGL